MKGNRMYVDIGSMLDELLEAAKNFGGQMKDSFGKTERGPWFGMGKQEENPDWYPGFSYPPMNIFLTPERSMIFEFALAGFEEKDIDLSFQGDYMVFSARISLDKSPDDDVHYVKRRLKLKDIEKQKYYVPAEKFEQGHVKAVYRNGILRISIPAKETAETNEDIKIEIVKEG